MEIKPLPGVESDRKMTYSNDFPSLHSTSFVCVCACLDKCFLVVISHTNFNFGTCSKQSARLGVIGTTFISNDFSFQRNLASFLQL